MRYINLLALGILIIGITTKISGQSRNYKSERLVIEAQSDKLRTAKGWKLDIPGNWISNENAISGTKLTEVTKYSVPQNFKWLQFALLKNGRQNIYALLYETTAYTSAGQSERRVYYFLMTGRSYSNIVSTIQKKTGETLTIHSSLFGYMSDSDGIYTAGKLLRQMEQSIPGAEKLPEYNLNLNAQHVDNEDVVRFRLPEQASLIKDESLKESYFETGLKDIQQLLLPVSSQAETDEFDLGNATVSPSGTAQSVEDDITDRIPAKPKEEDFSLTDQKQTSQTGDSIRNGMQHVSAQEPIDAINDRTAKETAIVSAPAAQLSGIEGWYLNPEGEWVTENDHSYKFETVGKYEMRNFKYRDKDYILITRFEKYAGASYYLISKEDYLNTLDALDGSSILRFPVVAYAGIGNTLRDMIELSEKTIDTPGNKDAVVYRTNYMVLQYKLSLQKNISRFFVFYQECSKYGAETSRENCNTKVSNKIKYDDEAILGSDILFNKAYYESTYNDFMNFFRRPASSGSLRESPPKEDKPEWDMDAG
ncbi:MAG: hypothetical protein LBL79_05270 [Prevotella sp.]|jgi:hypothetical protein|nr:hypothetical protein [Prevotella sp.]